ncbi:unnamed protein product [Cylindrotheca closterium]|uniref:Uncharacterized protein n=1 Tax=Cylindrotheca closterium TaxID=2856 RepID=A0AAD2JHB5_9STRA|nr:unnamed protein product [Cylindrotheca closterium]
MVNETEPAETAASNGSNSREEEEEEQGLLQDVQKELTQLNIDDTTCSLSTIANGAFCDPRYLVQVFLEEACTEIGDGAFEGCAGLQTVEMASTIRQIGKKCFSKCSSLDNISLPPGLKAIPKNTFSECESLVSIDVPLGVVEIGKNCFHRCVSLANVSFVANDDSSSLSQLQTIGGGAFKCCLALRCIHLPSTVRSIGKSAFLSCVSLKDVQLPHHGLQVIQDHTFFFCEALEKISLPMTVYKLGTGAFQDCKSLLHVTNAQGLQHMGERAFKNCTKLGSVSTSLSGLVSIGYSALSDCHRIVQIDLQDGLTEIPARCFANCERLRYVSIPNTLDTIGTQAFSWCTALLGIRLPPTKVFIGNAAFVGCESLMSISISSCSMSSLPLDISATLFSKCKNLLSFTRGYDLRKVLCDRYADLPVHQACYDSWHTTVDDLTAAITAPSSERPTDFFAMTPFHILVTCAKLRPDLLQVLLDYYPAEVVWMKDISRQDILGYIFRNMKSLSPDANIFVEMVLEKTVLDVMHGYGLTSWRSDICSQLDSIIRSQGRDRWLPDLLDGVIGSLARYKKLEMTSVLDLALWKWSLDSFLQMDRAECWSLNRAELVIPSVVSFLWDESTLPTSIIGERSNRLVGFVGKSVIER